MSETDPDQVLQQLSKLSGVKDYVVLNRIGIPIKYSMEMTEQRAIRISGLVSELVIAAREFLYKRYPGPAGTHSTGLEPADVVVMRLRTKKNEIIIAPDENYTLVVLHNPNYVEPVEIPDKDTTEKEKD